MRRHSAAKPSSLPGQWRRTANDSGSTNDTAQDRGDDDGIVRVAEHGYEVGDQIERQCQVSQQHPEPNAHTRGQRLVCGQSADKAKHVGEDSEGLAH